MQDRIRREDLRSIFDSIRHEIEDASGKSIIEDCLFGSHQLYKQIFADLPEAQKGLATKMINETRTIVNSY